MDNTPTPLPTPAAPADAKKPFLTWTRVNLVFPAIVVAICFAFRVVESMNGPLKDATAVMLLSVGAQFAIFLLNINVCQAHAKGNPALHTLLIFGSTMLAASLIFIGCAATYMS